MEEQKGGTFINGKEQVIEILRLLSPEEKAKLLSNIGHRNPAMARELSEKCLSFDNLKQLSDAELKRVMSAINPKIIGVALKGCDIEFQRRTLAVISRDLAEEAFEVLTASLANERSTVPRAQDKLLSMALELNRKGQINLGH